MPSSTPAQLRVGIASYLTAHVPGLRAITDGESVPSPPVAVVLPAPGKYIDYQVSFGPQGGAYNWSTRIIVLVSRGDVRAGTVALDGFLSSHGATSIAAALAADPSCGGVADFVVPVEAAWEGSILWAGEEYMGGTITLDVGAE